MEKLGCIGVGCWNKVVHVSPKVRKHVRFEKRLGYRAVPQA